MKMPKLTNVSCKYGAPMGRPQTITEQHRSHKFNLVRLPFVDYYYDQGGAYWGRPANLYRAWSPGHAEPQEMFVRASSRTIARALVKAQFPRAKFYV